MNCGNAATHISGVRNVRPHQFLCVQHTNERVLAAEDGPDPVWFRSLDEPRLTTRERRAARAGRLTEWAGKREAKAEAVIAAGEPMRSDWAFITQPGHMPERARLIARENRALESLRKAEDMSRRAQGIEAQLASSIYSDDVDAVDRLRERLAVLEAERDRVKAFNVSCRKGAPDWSILTEAEQAHHRRTLQVAGWQCKGGAFPSYHLSNLSGNIKRNRDRLAELLASVEDHGPGCDGPLNCVCS